MRTIKLSCAVVTLVLSLAACSTHCTCPPQQQTPPSTTTIIHEPPSNNNYGY